MRRALREHWPEYLMEGVLLGGFMLAAIIYSPWGKRSGAHINPAWTLTTLRLGRAAPWDAAFYAAAQFAGASAGVLLASALLGPGLAHADVHYVTTRPGAWGVAAAAAEVVITAVLWAHAGTRRGRGGPLARQIHLPARPLSRSAVHEPDESGAA